MVLPVRLLRRGFHAKLAGRGSGPAPATVPWQSSVAADAAAGREPPGAEPAYKYGIVELYVQLNVPVVPVAHSAGLFWPRRKMLRYPGTIHARFLPPIPAGLPREEFQARLQAETEAACDAYLVEAATGPNPPPMPATAIRRLEELGVDTAGLPRR